MIRHSKSGGPCQITIADKETGEVLFNAEGYLKSYSTSISARHEPIHMLGEFIAVEHLMPSTMELSLSAIITSMGDEKPKAKKKDCVHEWSRYEGFAEQYDYCIYCDKKRK